MLKGDSISTSTISEGSPQGLTLPQEAPRSALLPAWLTNVPFILVHLVCLFAIWTGVNPVALILCAALYLVRMFGITAGYHRYFSHRSYKTSRIFQFCMACLGCSALQKGPLWWAAHHRNHHLYSDTPDDPHSPIVNNFWWSHLGWILDQQFDKTDLHMVRDWTRYPELRWLNRNHWVPGILMAVGCFLIGGWSGLIWGFFISTVLLYHAVFAVNSLCHVFGRRRYATSDDSRNNLFVALITLGEGWHNNHHYYQSSANQGFFWWEIDVSYYVIKFLGVFGVVWDIRKPSRKKLLAVKKAKPEVPVPAKLELAAVTATPGPANLPG